LEKKKKITGYQKVPTEAQCTERRRSMHTWKYKPDGDKANGQFKKKQAGKVATEKEALSDEG
jgi:hypothetical protein